MSDREDRSFWESVYEKPVNLYMGHAHTNKFGPARKCVNKHCTTFITLDEQCPLCYKETKLCGK